MAISSSIPFRSMPQQSDLFLSYVDMSPKALAFYQRAATIDNLEQAAHADLGGREFPREEITSILRRQNIEYESDASTLAQIEDLRDRNCVAVLTGQQVGLFSGPLYTIYKAFSAIRIAERLRGLGIPAVPIFWMDTEDHDLAEVTHRTTLGRDFSPIRSDCRQLLFGDALESLQSVGTIRLPERVDRLVQEGIQWNGEKYADAIRQVLASTYNAGSTFSEAFGLLMARLFKGYGLILFDPLDAGVKRLLIPVYRVAVEKTGQINSSLLLRSAALESAGFHAQVNVLESSTVLFHQDRGERRPLTRSSGDFVVKGTDIHFSTDELLARIEDSPELFSSNVLLRPIAQDYLFPTLAYVGGPAEIAYFAQTEVLYRLFARPMPVIWPRCGFTLIEPEIAEKLDRYKLDLADCFGEKDKMIEKAVKSTAHSKAGAILDQLNEDVDASFKELHPRVAAADSSLGPAMETAKSKIIHHLHSLKVKFTQLDALQSGSVLQDLDTILNYCYPNRNFQERELCIVDFLVRRGPALMDTIYASCQVDRFAHGIIRMES
jgi:bacillithiol synthase